MGRAGRQENFLLEAIQLCQKQASKSNPSLAENICNNFMIT